MKTVTASAAPLLLLLFSLRAAAAADGMPNIVLIMADDFGYECVSANGSESCRTPHLDRLAESGMRFEQCHVQPLCTPTRVQLMTGIYNVRNYIEFGLLDPDATTFAHLLKQKGYATAITGKWQLGKDPGLPQHFGFDESCLWQLTRRPPRYANPGLEYNGVERDFSDGEYGPQLVNDFALDFITRHQDQPFFLYYPMILTHDPFQPTPDSPDWNPETRSEREQRNVRHFPEMTAFMDAMVGRLVSHLDSLSLREKTLVLFLGDNGTSTAITTRFRGRDYRGGKGKSTAAGTHVPLIASWPGQIPAGAVNSDLVSSVDFLPTLCEAAGTAVPAALRIDGQSFLNQLKGQPGTPRRVHYCWYSRNGGPTATFEFAMTRTHKLYRDGRLFDLESDPLEEQALTDGQLSVVAGQTVDELRKVLDDHTDARPARFRK